MSKRLIQVLLILLSFVVIGMRPSFAQQLEEVMPLDAVIRVPGGEQHTSITVTNENIRTVLRNLSEQGGFNLVIDDSVNQAVTLELNDITIDDALQSIAALGGLEIVPRSGNIYMAITKKAASERGLDRHLSKVIKIHYSSASRIADLLNRSLFPQAQATAAGGSPQAQATQTPAAPGAMPGAGGGQAANQRVRMDPRTNSIIIVGTQREIELAEEAARQLDRPRESKTFFLSNANALDVAGILASSVFNDGTNILQLTGNGGAAGAATGGGAGGQQPNDLPASLRVNEEQIREGKGVNDLTSESDSGRPLSQEVTLRGTVKQTKMIDVSPKGALIIPDTRTNSITIMGTAEQIAMVERVMPVIDARLPQVAIEATLVEITHEGLKDLNPDLGIAAGKFQLGFNNRLLSNNATTVGLPTVDVDGLGRSGINFSTDPQVTNHDYVGQIRTLMQTSKAKVLANPTIVATHDTETLISIVEEIVRRVKVTIDATTGLIQTETEIGEAGIVLDILPKIGDDGTVSMRLRPSVTSIKGTETDSLGNLITLLSKRDFLTQAARVADGETLVIGGLISESDKVQQDKTPLLGDMPIIGAMFRSAARTDKRSELVLLVTPHIINKTEMTNVSATQPVNFSQPIGQ